MFDNKITYNYSSPIAGIDKPNGANISSQIIHIQLQVKTHTSKQYLLTLSNELVIRGCILKVTKNKENRRK